MAEGLPCGAENWAFFKKRSAAGLGWTLTASCAVRLDNRIPDVVKTSLGD
jgi:hypothetical protein